MVKTITQDANSTEDYLTVLATQIQGFGSVQTVKGEAMETMELKLNSPITKEQWELLTDANLEHSDTMWFSTPNGNNFEYKKVRNGKWIENDNGTFSCNRCHSWIPNEQRYYARFCLYCGADMREVDDVRKSDKG